MGLAQKLLQCTADGDSPEVVAMLLSATGNTGRGSSGEFRFGGQVDDATALERVANGGAAVAVSLVRSTGSTVVLRHVVDNDRRRVVRRAVLDNPAATEDMVVDLLRSAAAEGDEETFSDAARRLDRSRLLDEVFTDAPVAEMRRHVERQLVAYNDETTVRRVLSGPFEDLRKLVVTAVAAGTCTVVGLDEALGLSRLDEPDAVSALLGARHRLTADQCRRVVDGFSSVAGAVSEYSCRFQLDGDGALALFRSGHRTLMVHAVTVALDEALAREVVASGDIELLDLACLHATDATAAAVLLPAVCAVLSDDRVEELDWWPYHRLRLPNVGNLVVRGLLDGDDTLALLRLCEESLTRSWVMGHTSSHPRPGDVTALVADPGWAFTEVDGAEPAGPDEFLEPDLLARAGHTAWTDELARCVPGLVRAVAEGRLPSMARFVLDAFGEAFGDDRLLWEQALALGESYTGTVGDLVKVAAVTSGRPLAGH